MIDGLRPYPSYESSSLPWLGETPTHWEVKRAKYFFREADDRSTTGEEELLSVSHITGVTPRSQKNIFMFLAESNVGHKVCQPNDVVVNTMWAWMAALGVARQCGIVSPSYAVYRPLPNNGLLPEYLDRLLRTPGYAAEYLCASTGINTSRLRLYPEQFLRIPIIRPPEDEQALIVRFLDNADRRIRRYIRAKQKLIGLLEEQKQAIIHGAITRGLDSNVRLKPSGVEWLGELPEHWFVSRLKAVVRRPLRNGLFKKKDAFGTGVPLINVADVYRHDFQVDPGSLERVQATADEIQTFSAQSGDLFFVRSSLKLEGTGRAAVTVDCEPDSVFECHLVQARPDVRQAKPRFLAFQLNSFALRHYLISRANVVTMATVAQDVLASCPVALPSISEQETLLEHIDSECAEIDTAMDRAVRTVSLLHEYRTRLVADVITGKLDVREAATRLSDEVEEPDARDEADALADTEEDTTDELDTAPEEAEA